MTIGAFKALYLVLTPTNPLNVPSGSVFIDETNANAMSLKDTTGSVGQITSTTAANLFIKQMQATGIIVKHRPVSKMASGLVIAADSDLAGGQQVIGFALDNANDGDLFNVLCTGPNLIDALTGLGYTPGQDIFLSEDGLGFTNDPNSFTGDNDSIIRVGIADCAAGTASSTATDLIAFAQVIVRS